MGLLFILGLGFNVKGGIDQPIEGDPGVFVAKINENGAAAKDGRLQKGDKIIEVSVSNISSRTCNKYKVIICCDGMLYAFIQSTPVWFLLWWVVRMVLFTTHFFFRKSCCIHSIGSASIDALVLK